MSLSLSGLLLPMTGGWLMVACWVWPPRRSAADVVGPGERLPRRLHAPRSRRPPGGEGPLAVAEAMDLLALALGSGAPVVSAVEAVAAGAGPLVRGDLARVAAALRWGVEPEPAWRALPSLWRPAGTALAVAAVAGIPPGALLHQAAQDVRESERRRLEESAARLSVRIVIPLGLCFLPAFALLAVVPIVVTLGTELMRTAA